ncbi:TetR/AcrR family transcriptional regulator [Pseudooceanicola lipolyticus]|uniref:TetR/AcrR family transcriptional regulator n=1 Tax=Pseudooceanicola lipolyticus TaxID=2029104 RepID=A0A2M8J3I2_9RHOB|nr:TetR/AcrR family transcriptional regulator [Pseudooceanicola lipolyticus]PJE37341.1 TetR/AcrR family transcriptional regulator [Pseudooceanicola lipolyticus]
MPRGVARDHDEKRAGLRAGAATYFARHGFDRASMSGAARECGVSKALIYHYYDSKEALLYDILDAHLSELVEVMEQARDAGIRGIIAAKLAAYHDADAEHKLQIDALATLPPEMQAPLIALQRRLVTTMSDAIRAERPDLDADRVRALTMSIFGILNWVYMWHRPGKGLSREAYADLAADFVLAGLKGLPE